LKEEVWVDQIGGIRRSAANNLGGQLWLFQ
jgi:hypothetical protein